jgi:hypothetical protein
MTQNNEVVKWKKKTYIDAEIIVEDWFYAKTPDLSDNKVFPFSPNAKFRINSQNVKRSIVEEIDIYTEQKEKEVKPNEEVSKIINTAFKEQISDE